MKWLCVLLAGCGGVDAASGLDADVRVANAQYFAGAMPAPTTSLAVTSIDSLDNTIRAGQIDKALAGRVDGAADAVALAMADDAGYWVVPAGAADLNIPTELTWSAKLSFATSLPTGAHDLEVAAVDGSGGFGPPDPLTLTVRDLDTTGVALAFALQWDTESDLDLHVIEPDGTIVWWGHPVAGDAILDVDSNDQCNIDGRREENVLWRDPATPPHGTYTVLVDTFSVCGQPSAHWRVDVLAGGDARAHAEGTVVDTDTRGDHVAGSGVQALTFTY